MCKLDLTQFAVLGRSGATLGCGFSEPTAKIGLRMIDGGIHTCHPARVGEPQDHEGKVDFPTRVDFSRPEPRKAQEAPTGPPSPPHRPKWQCHVTGGTPECTGGAGWPPRRESADAAPVRSSKVDTKSTNPERLQVHSRGHR